MIGVSPDTLTRANATRPAETWRRASLCLAFGCALGAFLGAAPLAEWNTQARADEFLEPNLGDVESEPIPPAAELDRLEPEQSWLKQELDQQPELAIPPTLPGRGSTEVPPDGTVLAEVRIEGNETIPTSAIERYVKTRPGRPITQQQVRDDRTALWGTRWFFNVETIYRQTEKGWVLTFKVLERPIVRSVEYRGAKKIKPKKLAAETGLVPNRSAFDVSVNREAARRIEQLYHDKGYRNATVVLEKGGSPDDRDVVFVINEGVKVRVVDVNFVGNKAVRSDQLLATKLVTKKAILWLFGGKYNPDTIPEDIAALERYYRGLGYFDVKIEHRVRFSENGARATIDYIIDEGKQYVIGDIELAGNRVFSNKDLAEEMKLQEGDAYNAYKLNKDVEKIRRKYGETGRIFASVEPVPRFREEPGVVDLVYQIDEDRVNFIRRVNVHIEGDHPHTKRAVVHNLMRVHPGDLADPRLIRLSKSRIEGAQIFERGPMSGVRIEVTPVMNDTELASHEEVRFQNADEDDTPDPWTPVPLATGVPDMPETNPAQNTERQSAEAKTADDILSEYGLRTTAADVRPVSSFFGYPAPVEFDNSGPTDVFVLQAAVVNDAPIIRGQSPQDPFVAPQSPLYQSSPQGDPLSPPPGQVDIDVFAPEARTGRLMFGVGVNSDAGVVGSVVLSEQNFDLFRPPTSWQDIVNGTAFRGGGQRFRLEAVPGSVVSRYLVSWTDPYFLDSPFSLGVSGFFYERFFDEWDEKRGGGRVSIGYQITPEFSMSVAARVENVEISNPDTPTPQILADAVGHNLLTTAEVIATHDTRDAAFLPSEGHIIEASFEQAYGEFNYPRAELDARQFFTLYTRPDGAGKHILSVGGQLGWTDSDTPIFERFFAGGFQSFRGFEFRGVSPRIGDVRIGGEWLAIGTVEYLFPILANEMVHGVVFSDFGTVENDVGFDDFRATAGAGLRVTVPAMGPVPLAFDFAFPIASEDEDDEQIFSFYIGFTR